jgi:putative colanic acid biosynthesis UDP-glucose lipid carrier transferase
MLTTACQLAMVTASYWGWLCIWQNSTLAESGALAPYLVCNEFLLVGILFGAGGNREMQMQHEWVVANRRSVRQTFFGLFCVFVVFFVARDTSASRSFFFSYVPCLYLTLLFSNYLLPRFLSRWSFSGDRQDRVALAGTPEQAARLKPWLEKKRSVGFHTVGLVCPEATQGARTAFPVLGTLDQTGEVLREHDIRQLIVLDLSLGSLWLRRLTHLCEENGVRMLALHDLNNYFNHTTTTYEDDGLWVIGLRDEPLESPLNRFLKRVLDLAVALPVVVLILPFTTVLVWILHRMQSPGPVFFKQVRTGMLGRPFTMYKYRTMHVNHNHEEKQASVNDPRVFPAGRWMRKFSMDELPQFLNVVLGDMSVVGPRPYLPKHEEMFIRVMRRYLIRKFIRPGVSGWAQANGFRGEIHTDEDIQKRVNLDIYYLENWSFGLDCRVILKTIKHCIRPPPGAY